MKVIYDTHTGGNTTYASITKSNRSMVLSRLQSSFYKMLEDAYYDPEKAKAIFTPNSTYRTNQNGGHNCLQTFLAGILGQHHSNPNHDFSVWQLQGIELASQVFDHYYGCGTIEFEKGDPHMTTPATLLDELFDR
jgi:hypothetical protein